MTEHVVIWSLRIEADSPEQAALTAAQVMPSVNSAGKATRFAVLDDPEMIERFFALDGTQIDAAKFFEWLKSKPTLKETPNES